MNGNRSKYNSQFSFSRKEGSPYSSIKSLSCPAPFEYLDGYTNIASGVYEIKEPCLLYGKL